MPSPCLTPPKPCEAAMGKATCLWCTFGNGGVHPASRSTDLELKTGFGFPFLPFRQAVPSNCPSEHNKHHLLFRQISYFWGEEGGIGTHRPVPSLQSLWDPRRRFRVAAAWAARSMRRSASGAPKAALSEELLAAGSADADFAAAQKAAQSSLGRPVFPMPAEVGFFWAPGNETSAGKKRVRCVRRVGPTKRDGGWSVFCWGAWFWFRGNSLQNGK